MIASEVLEVGFWLVVASTKGHFVFKGAKKSDAKNLPNSLSRRLPFPNFSSAAAYVASLQILSLQIQLFDGM